MGDEEENDANYKSTLIHFMNWRDEAAYERDHEFTQEKLGGITADEIAS